MRLYIESNFPLELARQQEEVAEAEELLKLAENGRIELIYPAIALTEPFSTNKNSKDFNETRDEFASRNCRYLSKFKAGLAFILAQY